MQEYLAGYAQNQGVVFIGRAQEKTAVFRTEKRRNAQGVSYPWATKAGVPVIPVHATRRTCASLLVALDVHPRVAMTILRHTKIALTMDIYSQVSSASTKEALKLLGNQFGEGVL